MNRSFFKSRLRCFVSLGMIGAPPQPRHAELAKSSADRAFVHGHWEALGYLFLQIDAPPAYDLMNGRVGTRKNQLPQFGHLRLRQFRCRATRSSRQQAVDALITVSVHPVAQRLTIHASLPRGAGHGVTGFASPTKALKVIHTARDLTTWVAETLGRDRLQGPVLRKLLDVEGAHRGATEVCAGAPLTLIDLRTTGLARLGLSTEAAGGKRQGQWRKLSQAVHDQTDACGLIHNSRLTGRTCICVYDRAPAGVLVATPVAGVTLLAGFVDPLRELNLTLIAMP